jgi:hypothetical protein
MKNSNSPISDSGTLRIQGLPQGWEVVDAATGWKVAFGCSALISVGNQRFDSTQKPWETKDSPGDGLIARWECAGVVQEVEIRLSAAISAFEVRHRIKNSTKAEIAVEAIRTVDGVLEAPGPFSEPAYLHSLNAREYSLPPLCSLKKDSPSVRLGGVSYPFFEGTVLWQGAGQPCVVTGALTQRIVHRRQQLLWDGGRKIELKTEQELRGIERKSIQAGQTLELDSVFVQFRADFDPNEVFADYLRELGASNGTRWEKNPLRKAQFYATWNDYLYWELSEGDVLRAARQVKKDFPSVTWFGVDDGYQVSTSNAHLPRRLDGELNYDHATEIDWYNHCPGVMFAFDGASGEDRKKFPKGLRHLADQLRGIGLRPQLWIGMEVSRHSPLAKRHPEWFHAKAHGEHLLPDVSVPEVRQRIEQVFQTYYGVGKFEAIKLDFYSRLFEDTELKYRCTEKTAAEWQRWFFEMLRACLPEDGYISLGCDIAAGTPFLAPWADSYRHSMDMRDGDWDNVKRNVRWSCVPLLTHGFAQPIADADSLSLFKRLSRTELECWADFAWVTGSLVELSGSPARWDEDGVVCLRRYLDRPSAGERVWFGDADCWRRDSLPRVFYREETAGDCGSYFVSLHNWNDEALTLSASEWIGPIRGCQRFEDLRGRENGNLPGAEFSLAPRSSRLLRVVRNGPAQ